MASHTKPQHVLWVCYKTPCLEEDGRNFPNVKASGHQTGAGVGAFTRSILQNLFTALVDFYMCLVDSSVYTVTTVRGLLV